MLWEEKVRIQSTTCVGLIGQCVNNLVLRWQHEKAHVYARHISENMELLAKFDEAERAGDVDKLDGILCAFVDCPGSEQ